MNKQWEIYNVDNEQVKKVEKELNISELIARILVHRGMNTKTEIETFLSPTRNDFHDPFLMPDMEKAVERIISAINSKEKIVIYGDYDADGITSSTVLKKYLKDRDVDAKIYIPNRLDEGYGLNKDAIVDIAQSNDLMITVDCGITR